MIERIEYTKCVSYQIGVDVLGFPIYEQHIIVEGYNYQPQTNKSGKNMTKNKIVPKLCSIVIQQQIKQL